MTPCPFDPEPLKDVPMGMFHCPECGGTTDNQGGTDDFISWRAMFT